MTEQDKKEISKLLYDLDMSTTPYGQLDCLDKLSELVLEMASTLRISLSDVHNEICPRFYVYDNINQKPDKDTIVLDPKDENDKKTIRYYIKHLKDKEEAETMQDWLNSFEELEDDVY